MIDLGKAPIGSIADAARKAIAVSKVLQEGRWDDPIVSFTFNDTVVGVRWDDTIEKVMDRYADTRRLEKP